MKQVIAMHGWSGNSHTWHLWAELFLKSDWIWQSGERGYGSLPNFRPIWEKEERLNSNSKKVIIAHSLGPHLIDKEIWKEATHAVLIGSFSKFVPNNQNKRTLEKALNGMEKSIGSKEEAKMLETFLEKASKPNKIDLTPDFINSIRPSINGRKLLKNDLKLLRETDGLPNGVPRDAKVLVIQGEKDEIIPTSTRESLLSDLKKHLNRELDYWLLAGQGHSFTSGELIISTINWLEST